MAPAGGCDSLDEGHKLDAGFGLPPAPSPTEGGMHDAAFGDQPLIGVYSTGETRDIYFYRKIYNENNLKHILETYDWVIPFLGNNYSPKTLKQQYQFHHLSEDWHIFIQLIQEAFPKKACDWIHKLERQFKMRPTLMMIMPFEEFDELMSWLFPFLFKLYERLTPSDDPYQKRAVAYLCERLLTVYFDDLIEEKQKRILESDFVFFNDFLENSSLLNSLNKKIQYGLFNTLALNHLKP